MIKYRTATVKDIDIIRDIASKTWFVTYREILSSKQLAYMFEMMYSEESLKRQMTEQKHVFFFACHNENRLGYVSIEQQEKDLFHLHKLYVLPDAQNKGIGKALIYEAFKYAKKASNSENCSVELNVNRHNKAIGFYRKMGLHISYEGDFYMKDYIMRIEL